MTTATITKATDREYEDHILTSVEKGDNGYSIGYDGLGFGLPDRGVEPHVGDVARFYGRGFGSIVRGVDVNSVEVFYRTPDEQDAENKRQRDLSIERQKREFEASRATLDDQHNALPYVFQQRLSRFRRNNPDFRWKYESYEMSCCVDAVKIAAVCGNGDAVKEFHDLPWDQQKEVVPDLFDGHSGNSFGQACLLARVYIEQPDYVPWMHGALCPLMGCAEYGCVANQDLND